MNSEEIIKQNIMLTVNRAVMINQNKYYFWNYNHSGEENHKRLSFWGEALLELFLLRIIKTSIRNIS